MTRLCCVTLAACLMAGSAFAGDSVLRVTVDQAKIAKLPPAVKSLVLGNPAIADVTMLNGGSGMVVTGRGYGQTNLIALDVDGHIIDEEQIRVDPPTHVLVVQRGDTRESYSCDPVCMPTAALGDDTKAFGEVSGQISAHDSLAGSKSGGGGGGGMRPN